MKNTVLVLLVSAFTVAGLYAQCSDFFDFQQGTEFEMESYNAKGKATGQTAYKVDAYEQTASGYTAKLDMTIYDNKAKEISHPIVDIGCNGGVYEIDMAGIIPQETMKSFQSLETTIKTDNLYYPSDLQVGNKLEDGYIEIKATSPIPMSMRVDMVNRKVEGREKITTPAGTFDCYKISYTINMKTIFSMSRKGVDYIAKGVGVVKTESFKSNGKLESYTLLTSYSK